jgi:hypothetical protein
MDLKSYLLHQKEEMLRYKWIKSQEAGRDLGEQALHEWIEKYGKEYREAYNQEYQELIKKITDECRKQLENKLPGVSPELWDYVFKTIIDKFVENWTKEIAKGESSGKRKTHLEEI